jgi:PAS domain S-box-containing protein
MARRMREYPWEGSALGDPGDWPSSLRTACRICLTSRFPMIVWWGPELRFLYNDAYMPLLGDKHPALGMQGREVWSEIWGTIGPMLDSVMSSGQATWSEDMLLSMRRHGYWEETYWTYSYSPLHDDDGTVRGVFAAVTESTEQVVGRRRLAVLQDLGAQAGRGRGVAEVCALVTEILSRAGQIVPYAAIYLRSADGTGSAADGAADEAADGAADGPDDGGATLAASTMPGPAPAWPAGEVLRGGRQVVLRDVAERFGRLPSGGWPDPPAEAMVLPLTGDAGGEPVGAIVLAASAGRALDLAYQDFLGLLARQTAALVNGAIAYQAQLRRAEELAALDRAKTTFFSNISHEFRTPLTLIMGPVEELRGRLDPAADADREALDVIRRNGLRLGKLVNSLLDFSRIEAGRMRAHYEPTDLSGFTGELASVFRSAIERAGLRYEVDCPALSAPVYVDREMWEKIVLNLLSNALKFTFDGGITVTLGEKGRQVVLRVADTGTGIPESELPRLFDRFHRVQHARARSNEGSGIGLALVRELVALHRGTITVESTEHEGTAFTVRLPFAHPAEGDDAGQGATGSAGGAAADAELDSGAAGDADAAGDAWVMGSSDAAGGAAGGTAGSAAAGGRPPLLLSADPYIQEAMRWLPPPADITEADDPPGAAATAGTRPGAPAAAGQPPGAPRVLLADDNADMREYLKRLLRASYQVSTVTDGQAALDAARARPPDLIISDVMMPRLDGLGLVSALRADQRTAGVPVLLLSARAGQEAAIEGLDAGADDYLVKPFSAAELLARVRASVQLSRMRGQHARWRAALIESLHEAFFLCGSDGAVLEINSAFTELLGYGQEGLPYPAPHPWWPDPESGPDARRMVEEAYRDTRERAGGSFHVPVRHRDGRRLWVAGSFNEITDSDNGRLVAGTLRDVTAEHYVIQRETALASLGQVLARAQSMPETLRGALGELHRLWSARRVVAAIWTDAPEPAVTASAGPGDWSSLRTAVRETLSELRERAPLTPVAARGGAGLSLEHPSGTLAIWLELAVGRTLTTEDQTLLSLVCGRLGQALIRAHQIDQQRETALALQRAILGPAQLPAGFAARYEPATRPLEVGGDWHDIIELPDGRIAIVVGDCVGHDLSAATVMGQLRSACRALLLQDASPGQVLAAMDRFAGSVPGAECTTVFCAVLDPATGRLSYSSAGHPPALVVHPDGSVDMLEGGRSFPLAAGPAGSRRDAGYLLRPRSTLLLYTDGLVERRGHALTDGIAEAGSAVMSGGEDSLEDLATRLMTALAPPDGYGDDVAMVLYRHPAPLDLTFPAETGQLPPARARLRQWLDGCGLGVRLAQDALVAAGEAVANAIEHGHRAHPDGEIRLRASVTAGTLRLTVTDSGRWLPPGPVPTPFRGKGIALMQAFMDAVSIVPDGAGTTVIMEARITGDRSA